MTFSPFGFDEDGVQDYMKAAAHHKILTREQEVELFQRLENGDETAREEIVQCNLRFVIKIAMHFKGMGLPLSDLIQEGNIGLLHVIGKFDWRKGFRFTTYAAYYIRQEIQASLQRSGNMIRIPVRKARLLSKLNEMTYRYNEREGRDPSIEEMSIETGVSREKIEAVIELRHSFASMDAELNEDGMTLGDSVAVDSALLPSETLNSEQVSDAVQLSMNLLTDREREVVELRFGMTDHQECMSLRQASKVIGLSQEGVRRVEHRALEKLRRPSVSAQLSDLLTA